MVVYCCVLSCKNCDSTVKKHLLPKDQQLRKKWCESIDRLDLVDIPNNKRSCYRVCDKHFSDYDKFVTNRNRTNLKANAVPTNVPGPGSASTFLPEAGEKSEIQEKKDKVCILLIVV